MMRCLSLVVALMVATSFSATVSAEPSKDHIAAEEHFRQGRDAYDRLKDYPRALKSFRASQALEPGRGKLLSIALCEEQLGQPASALKHLQELVSQFPKGDDRLPIAREHIAKLVPRVPWLRVDLASNAPGRVQVTLDGVPLKPSEIGADVAVDPGKHILVVMAPGHAERLDEVMLTEGKRVVLVVEPGAAVVTPDMRRSLVPGVVLGVVALAGFVTGAVGVGMRHSLVSDAEVRRDDLRSEGKTCVLGAPNYGGDRCLQQSDATANADTYGSLSVASFVVGGVATAGALTYFLWPNSGTSRSGGRTVYVAPMAGGVQRGVLIWGSF